MCTCACVHVVVILVEKELVILGKCIFGTRHPCRKGTCRPWQKWPKKVTKKKQFHTTIDVL